jgi:hypothetical protein
MKLASALILLSALSSLPAFAAPAKLRGTDSSGKKIVISLDSKGSPHIVGRAGSSPTIKDLREDAEVRNYCYEGSEREARLLLTALVYAANGDGDSWAELRKITKGPRGLVVSADITDEGGKREENYLIGECR